MSDRKFYKNVVSIVVLTEDGPWDHPDTSWLHYDITDGECVGYNFAVESVEVTADQMAELLGESGSDPSFFGLDEERPMHDTDGFDIEEG